MRPSNRTKILDAAVRVIEREGLTAVTFDSVAAEAQVTRGGMMYHFPARDALIRAIHEHLASQWESALESAAGKSKSDATEEERAVAYARTSARGADRAELLAALHSFDNPGAAEVWDAVLTGWASPPPADVGDHAAMARFSARLAADGLWMYDVLSGRKLTEEVRSSIAAQIVKAVSSAK